MPDKMTDLIEELALANRILAHEGVLDAFGHVSVRHPTDPGRYLLSRSRSPLLIEPDDILEFTLDSEPVRPPKVQLYAERVIHGCIYQARRDVMAVCHHHAPAIMPFAIAGKPIVPVFHLGATVGEDIPFWDQYRRIRRHQPSGGQAGGGPLAGAGARRASGGADEPAWCNRGRRQFEGACLAFDLHVPERRLSVARACARHAATRCTAARSSSPARSACCRMSSAEPGNIGACGLKRPAACRRGGVRQSGAPADAEILARHAARAAQGQAALNNK